MSNLPPGVDPFMIPLLKPPPGQTSNFVDPPSLQPNIYASVSILYGAMTITLVARLWLRFIITHSPGWDDLFAILTWLITTIITGSTFRLVTLGIGRHAWDVPVGNFGDSFSKTLLVDEELTPFVGAFLKLTVLCLLLRIFPRHLSKHTYVFVWIGIVLVSVFGLVMVILTLIACTPRGAYNQAHAISPTACRKVDHWGDNLLVAINAFNFVMDLYIFVVPLFAVWTLNTSFKRRIGISLVLSAGLASCAFSLATFILRIINKKNPDFTYYQVFNVISMFGEICIGSMAANLPCLTAFWKHIKEFRSFNSPSAVAKARFFLSGARPETSDNRGSTNRRPGAAARMFTTMATTGSHEDVMKIAHTMTFAVTSHETTGSEETFEMNATHVSSERNFGSNRHSL